jgi:hypothetical protein
MISYEAYDKRLRIGLIISSTLYIVLFTILVLALLGGFK